MLHRVLIIALNTYREAVRGRILHGLFGLAIATGAYALVVGAYALRDQLRVVADLGAAAISVYGIVVAIVMGATSLYRELELKTIFPMLARPIRRGEYLVGKYLGTLLTLAVFGAAFAGLLLFALGALSDRSLASSLLVPLSTLAIAGLVGVRFARWRTWLPLPVAVVLLLVGAWFARDAIDDRRVILGGALLALLEVAIICAVAMVFSAFSSPFLTAVFTFSVVLVGRSADTLARMPEKIFGSTITAIAQSLSHVVPNLMVYVPPRPILTGEAAGISFAPYAGLAAAQSLAWSLGLLAVATIIFRRRDFL